MDPSDRHAMNEEGGLRKRSLGPPASTLRGYRDSRPTVFSFVTAQLRSRSVPDDRKRGRAEEECG